LARKIPTRNGRKTPQLDLPLLHRRDLDLGDPCYLIPAVWKRLSLKGAAPKSGPLLSGYQPRMVNLGPP
jgi:hypothetical protein